MTTDTQFTVSFDLDQEELEALLQIARRRGFSDVGYYLRQLVDLDAYRHDEDIVFGYDTPDEIIIESFREGMKEAIRGEGRPIEELFAELRAEQEAEKQVEENA